MRPEETVARRTAIALFAKAPRPGFVKTRLTGAISAEDAAEFHLLCVRDSWDKIRGLPGADSVLYTDVESQELAELARPGQLRLQRGTDLGEKMRNCLAELLAGGYENALILGGDSPTIPAGYIAQAVERLSDHDVVLGPTHDGGFYLIGARQTSKAMFAGVTWSDSLTKAQTIDVLARVGYSVAEVAPWYDVDEPSDLERLRDDAALSDGLREWFTRHPPTLQ